MPKLVSFEYSSGYFSYATTSKVEAATALAAQVVTHPTSTVRRYHTRIFICVALSILMASEAGGSPVVPTDIDSPNAVDQYALFVGDTFAYDDNVFRIPQTLTNISSLLSPNASRQDHINTVSVGTYDQWFRARQQLALNVQFGENYFDRNKYLDNTSANGSLVWTWQFADAISGDLGGEYIRQLANSSQTLFYGKDLVGSASEYADARYQIGSTWDVFGGIRASETTNSAVELHINNYHSKSVNAGFEYLIRDSDKVGIEYLYADARAVQNVAEIRFAGQDYNEERARLTAHYELDDKTQIDAEGGYLKRYYPNTDVGAFSGDVWRFSLSWQTTDKTRLSFSAWRDLEAYLDAESNYFVARGESISPTWTPSEKISVNASAQWVTQDYIASSPVFLTLGERHDTLHTQQLSVVYTPIQSVTFTLSYDHEGHSSTVEFFSYGDRLWTGSIRVTF